MEKTQVANGSHGETAVVENSDNGDFITTTPQVLLIEQKINSLFTDGNLTGLREYLTDELNIPEKLTHDIISAYKPGDSTLHDKLALVTDIKTKEVKNAEVLNKNPRAKVTSPTSSEVFEKIGLQLNSDLIWPKNVLAWYILKKVVGEDCLDFEIPVGATPAHGKNKIIFKKFPINVKTGQYVKLGVVAVEAGQVGGIPIAIAQKMQPLLSLGELGVDFIKMMINAQFALPPKQVVNHLAHTLKVAQEQKHLVIVGAFCPDYSYEKTGDTIIPYRYNFKTLGGGVGLVAQQFQRVLPFVAETMDKHHIRTTIKLGIGDFESNSDDILRRMKHTKEEFVNKCAQSLLAFREALPTINMELCLLEKNWIGDRFAQYKQEAFDMMTAGNFGKIHDFSTRDIAYIAKAGKRFYSEWHGRDIPDQEIMQMIIAQGSEYSAATRCFTEDFVDQAVLQLAGDRPAMQLFNNLWVSTPALCTKRTYA